MSEQTTTTPELQEKDYMVKLNDGSTITFRGTFNAATFTQDLNSHSIGFVNIGEYVLQKHTINMVIPLDGNTTLTQPQQPQQ